jgi:hypothetical protein
MFGCTTRRGGGVVQLMSEPGRQRAERGELLALSEQRLRVSNALRSFVTRHWQNKETQTACA